MKPSIKFLIFFATIVLICTSCRAENNSGQGQENVPKPPPQVRVEVIPSATATLPLSTAEAPIVTPTPDTSGNAVIYTAPTMDIEALANQIEANMSEIQRELNNNKFILKP